MFNTYDLCEMFELLKAKSMASLDLAQPASIPAVEDKLAKSLGEVDILDIYDHLSLPLIGSFNLAGLAEKYRFRIAPYGTTVMAVSKDGNVKVVDTSGRVLFVANPNTFFPIPRKNGKVMSNFSSFPKFGELPAEIRHKIWGYAAEPRYLVATEVGTPSFLSSFRIVFVIMLPLCSQNQMLSY